ncbi:MAG: hypothetical protein ACLS69_04790 [Butyricicoccus sp.]
MRRRVAKNGQVVGGSIRRRQTRFSSPRWQKVYLISGATSCALKNTTKLDKPNVEMVWDSVVEEILENGRAASA